MTTCSFCGAFFEDEDKEKMERHPEECPNRTMKLEQDLIETTWKYIEDCRAYRVQPDRMKIVNDFAHHFISTDFYLTLEDTQDIFIFSKIDGIYQPGGNQHIRRNLQRLLDEAKEDEMELSKFSSTQTINEIIDTVRRLTMKKRDEIEPPKNLVCLKNGVLDTDLMELQPFSPQYYFFSKLAVSYDPSALCPEIDKFFLSTLEPTDIPLIEEITGACLIREDPWQKAICAIGEGSNGKSTLIRMLVEFLGRNNTSSVSLQELENDRFSIANLYGKHANLVADMAADDLKSTAKFKSCTGGDLLRAQNKHGQPFFFINYAKFFISCNRLPKTPDGSLAFFRRFIIIKFSRTFDGCEDRGIGERIITPTELSGFLNRAIKGCKRLREKGHYSYNSNSAAVREMYVHLSDSATAFCNDRLEVNDEEEGISKDEIWNTYLKFCKENHILRVADKPFWETVRENFMLVEYRPDKNYDPLRRRMLKGVKMKQISVS
jgi:putative DNA primase/helicase